MGSSESRFIELGIPPELSTPKFAQTPLGQLATKLLDRTDRKLQRPKIKTIGRQVQPQDQSFDYRWEAVDLLAKAHNTLDGFSRFLGAEHVPYIFSSQAEFDRLEEGGLIVLSEKQAQIALTVLESEDAGEKLFKEFSEQTRQRAAAAEEQRDLPTYLMWSLEAADQHYRKHDVIVNDTIHHAVIAQPLPAIEELLKEIEENKQRFLVEARMAKRMHQMLAALPDNDKIKAVIIRAPAETDRARPPRALTNFPAKSFSRWSDDANETNDEALELYCMTDAPCLNHALDNLYKLTRYSRLKGEFLARAFYMTSQSAYGFEGIRDFPTAAQRFLEVSFADGTPPFPPFSRELNNPRL